MGQRMRGTWWVLGLVVTLTTGVAEGKRGSYAALFRCWQALETEGEGFGDPAVRFGRLKDGVYFLRSGGVRGTVTLFHAKGVTSYRITPRRPPAYLVASVAGKPAFYVAFQAAGDRAGTITIEYFAAGDRKARVLSGRRTALRAARRGVAAAAALRSRLGPGLEEARAALENEKARLLHEMNRLPVWARIRPGELSSLLGQRLGRLASLSACGDIGGRLGAAGVAVAAALRELRSLADHYDRSPASLAHASRAGEESTPPKIASIPLFPGARLATVKETRCLGLDSWDDEYEVRLAFAVASARDVARFYQRQFGLRPQATPRGFRLVLMPPSPVNPLGDHIDVIGEAPARPCATGTYTVRVAIFRRKRA